jgi:glutamate/tyrosine decarboxylase-like PLP-dependent enzyme
MTSSLDSGIAKRDAREGARQRSPLAMDPDEFRRAAELTARLAADHVEHTPDRPVYRPVPEDIARRLLHLDLPDDGVTSDDVLQFFAENVMPYDMGNQHPTFAAWVNPAAAPIGTLLDFLASVMNPSAAYGNQSANYVEQCVLRWLRDLVGFPDGAEAILVDGGSLANLHGLSAALQRACVEDGWDLNRAGLHGSPRRPVLYASREAHNCIRKSTRLLGLGEPSLVEVDADRRLRVDALADSVHADRAHGHRPFCVVASAGTVNTGVVDPLEALADFCNEEGLWLHVDGAYGAFGLLDASVAHLYRGIDRVDSLALDPHKWLAVPNTCSCIMVRDGDALREAFDFSASYLTLESPNGFGIGKRYDVLGIYQTRRFLAAKLLGVMLQLGRNGLRAHVERHVGLARRMAAIVTEEPDLELVATGDLTVVCFRFAPPNARGGEALLDVLNRTIRDRIQVRGRVFVAGTELEGRFVLRSCALHYDLDERDVQTIVAEIRDVGKEVYHELVRAQDP